MRTRRSREPLSRQHSEDPGPAPRKRQRPAEDGHAFDAVGNHALSALLHSGRLQRMPSEGQALDASTRGSMEARFGETFQDVRIHTGSGAAEMAGALHARAFTTGSDIVFAKGKFAPETAEGQRLLAHELAHVVQQRKPAGTAGGEHDTERDARDAARQVVAGGAPTVRQGAEPGSIQRDPDDTAEQPGCMKDESRTLTVVIRAPDAKDNYTKNVVEYLRNTCKVTNIVEVEDLRQVFDHLKGRSGPKLKNIRLIGHGSTAGGIKMRVPGKNQPEFVNPSELTTMADDKDLQKIASDAMDPDGSVDFYGCYVGGTLETGLSLSKMFQSKFRSSKDALHTEEFTFDLNGKIATKSSQIDDAAQKDKKIAKQFDDWLLQRHAALVAAHDLPDSPTREEKLAATRELFDRSHGRILQLVIEKQGGVKVRPGQEEFGKGFHPVDQR